MVIQIGHNYNKPLINATSISATSITVVKLFVTISQLKQGQTSITTIKMVPIM